MPFMKKLTLVLIALSLFITSQNVVLARSGLFSEKEEIRWGQSAAETTIKGKGLSEDQTLQERATNTLNRLLPNVKRKNLPYQVRVIKDKAINAFTYPGGQIFVTEALMRQAATNDELAFVIGHEIGHTENYHIVNAVERSLLTGLLTYTLFRNDQDLGSIVGTVVQVSMSRGYGFKNEHQADYAGFRLATQAGYNPAGGAVFFHELQEKYGDGSQSIANFVSPHPKNSVRIDNQLAYLKDFSGKRITIELPKTKEQKAAAIYIDNQLALTIQAAHDNWSAVQRAEWVAGRLSALLHHDQNLIPDGFSLKTNENGDTVIYYNETNAIVTIWPEDATEVDTNVQTIGMNWIHSLVASLQK